MQNIKLIISYDGTGFFGWQKAAAGPTIEGELSKALERILGHEVELDAASRTDRGVHAEGQPVRFFSTLSDGAISLSRLIGGLNAVMPVAISVRSAEIMPDSFHPTLHATGKEYHYYLTLGEAQNPIWRLYSWHVFQKLNFAEMEKASNLLLGKKDFSALANEKARNPICNLQKISFSFVDGRFKIALCADRFLYKMARNLVGLLVAIGCGKFKKESIALLLASRDRTKGALTAPAHGLFLSEVFYDFPK